MMTHNELGMGGVSCLPKLAYPEHPYTALVATVTIPWGRGGGGGGEAWGRG